MQNAQPTRHFDLYRLIADFWQNRLQPFAQRISVRITRRGFYVIAIWASWVIIWGFLTLVLGMAVVQTWFSNTHLALLFTVFNASTLMVTAILAGVFLADYWRLLKNTQPLPLDDKNQIPSIYSINIRRQLPNNLSTQAWTKVTLLIEIDQRLFFKPQQHSKKHRLSHLKITLTDNYPTLASCEQLPIVFMSQALYSRQHEGNRQLVIEYQLFAHERGMARFDGVDILIASRIGWLTKYCQIPESRIQGVHEARVLANFANIVQGQLAGVSRQTAVNGMLKQRKRGQGQDFHQIRNYSQGDSVRHLDWKATARYQRLMTREYQDERDQHIIFLLDCGQHMRHIRFFDPLADHIYPQTSASSQGSHLDQALNAMLLLASVANQQGDATGFISFAAEHNKVVPAKKGSQVISYLLNQSFDLQPSNQIPDYLALARQVRQIQKKRALMILITNTRQEETSELLQAIQLLRAKHVILLANLYEQDLADYLATPPVKLSQALTYHSVQEYINSREQLHALLTQQSHVHCLNTTPTMLPKLLIQQYFMIKQRHQL